MERGGVCLKRDFDDKRLGQSKVLCCSSRVELLIVNYYADFPALSAPERQISGYPPASGSSRTTLTRTPPCRLCLVTSFYLARFLAHPVSCPRFCLRGLVGLIVGLAIGDAISIVGEVVIGLSGLSLWNKLMSFLKC